MKFGIESINAAEAIQKESPQLNNKFFRNQLTQKYL